MKKQPEQEEDEEWNKKRLDERKQGRLSKNKWKEWSESRSFCIRPARRIQKESGRGSVTQVISVTIEVQRRQKYPFWYDAAREGMEPCAVWIPTSTQVPTKLHL